MKKQAIKNIFSIFFISIILSMPYGSRFEPFILALFTIFAFSFFYTTKSLPNRINLRITLLPIFAIFGFISLMYSKNYFIGLKVLERHISFIIIPLSFSLFSKNIFFTKKNLSLTLAISLLISYAVSLIHFKLNYSFVEIFYRSKSINHFIQLLRINGFPIQHPSYFSYLILIWLLFFIQPKNRNKFIKILNITTFIISLIFIILLGSRAAILSLFALLFYLMIRLLIQKHFILFSIIFSIQIFSGVSVIKFSRLSSTINKLNKNERNYKKSDSRFIIWQNAITLIKQKPILGYGIGDALDVMIIEHERTGFEEGVEKRLDAHNQFLETWLQSGLIGLISLLLVFAFPFYQSIKKRQELLFLFLLISFIQFLFESMFIRLAGVVYFSFFYSYLYYYYYAPGGEWELKFTNSKKIC